MKRIITLLFMVCFLFSVYADKNSSFKVNPVYNNSIYSKQENNSIVIPGSEKPRRVKGYTETGDSIDTNGNVGNPDNMWQEGYSYYYYNGHWYRSKNDSWYQWNTLLGLGLFGWDWQRSSNPGNGATQYYENNPTPVGNGYIIFLLFCIIYASIKIASSNYHTLN